MKLLDPTQAAMLKDSIADCQSLVDDKNVRIYTRRNCESEANVHAARVSLHRLIEKLTNLCKVLDGGKEFVCFSPRQAQQRRVHEKIFYAREFRIKTSSQFQQRRDSPFVPNVAMCGRQGSGNNLQKGRLSATVRTD